jgi:hypothetical protein
VTFTEELARKLACKDVGQKSTKRFIDEVEFEVESPSDAYIYPSIC